nr:transporter substrate-binding domain-containing protein [Saliniradius amylolyticus]
MHPKLPHQGLMTHIVQVALKRMGINLKLLFIPWARAIQMVKNGEADGIVGIYPTKQRKQYLTFSDPVFVEQNALYARTDDLVRFAHIDDLKPYSIGVVRDAANGEPFDSATQLNKVLLTSNQQSIDMLLLNRIDLLAGPERVIEYLLSTQFPERQQELVRLTPIIGRKALSVAIRQQYPDAKAFMQQFNEHLAALKQDGSYDRIIKEHGVKLLSDDRLLK